MRKLNINELIKVKLTDLGKDVYYHQYDVVNRYYGKEIIKPHYPEVDENGFTEFQLHEFMNLYGPLAINGGPQFIKDNNIYIYEKDLREINHGIY